MKPKMTRRTWWFIAAIILLLAVAVLYRWTARMSDPGPTPRSEDRAQNVAWPFVSPIEPVDTEPAVSTSIDIA